MNYKFELDDWLSRLPLQERYGLYQGAVVTGPCDICNNEHLRRELLNQYVWGPPVPVDVFVMADGEPDRREATKIGGLPYRPASSSWPMAADGEPSFFLAQFNFEDSRDLTGELPGDVLLVFATGGIDGPVEPHHFEWRNLDLTDLISPDDVPAHPFAFAPCFGHICRTISYPHAERLGQEKYPSCRGKEVWSAYHLPQYQATQIGQAPFFIQKGDHDLPGRLLCTISSVSPDCYGPYPWVNHAERLFAEGDPKIWDAPDYLQIDDTGCVYIAMDEKGALHWNTSSY